MQHRQATVIGAILAVMVVAVAVSLLVSLGILPAYNPGFSQPKSTATYVPQTCPPSGAKTVDVTTIEKINVYNGSETVGLAGTVQQELEEAGLTVTSANDWPGGIYNGEVQIMASKGGLTNAYSLAQIFPKSTVQLDKSLSDDDTTVSVVLGKEYLQNALKADEIKLLGAGKPITAPSDCVPADKAATKKPS
ncbi:LytR C-terminal domain-containing protein [Actinomyces oris]|uniref:LytR C-terminal domain-containing protein n=1 Tax=Actinomyces oris TaxID=544580 RepID=UPI0028D6560F|nr:LytR C-terminal domain-containing protein [Actinomyces oris]